MKASVLKKLYPQVWESVYDTMFDDICNAFSPENVQTETVERLAHNSAFLATLEVHRARTPKK